MKGKKTVVERCVFCNSAKHHMTRCNSNMNGRREYLDQGWDCMLHDICPNFTTLRANELRYIAYNFVQYTGAIHNPSQKTSQHYNRKYGLNPIPLSYSKQKLINELVRRWNMLGEIRALIRTPPEEPDDDCHICLECITSYTWSNTHASWKLQTNNKYTTQCKHSFCKSCFNTNIETSSTFIHDVRFPSKRCVGCPYCRTKLYYSV